MAHRYRAIGLMSGTSIDAIDIALIETDGTEIAALGPAASVPYAAELRDAIRAALGQLDGCDEVGRALTEAHATAVGSFFEANGIDRRAIDVVGFHGHTVSHRPDLRRTRQIGDPAWLARELGVDVVGDFRQADVAAGGQGAPLAPIYHAHLLGYLGRDGRRLAWPVAVLNIGGVANVTYVDEAALALPERLLAFDTGPGNALIDDWVLAETGQTFDRDGRLAAAGRADRAVVAALLDDPYFARKPPKSLDRDDFAVSSLRLSPADGAATFTAFTVESVLKASEHLPERPGCWLVTGGGRHNRHLVDRLAGRVATPVRAIEAVGGRGDSLEAEAFAFMAVRALRGFPISFPGTTGVPEAVTGGASTDQASLSGSFIDYGIPRAADLPMFEATWNEIPCLTNPLGVKGAAEGGTDGALAAVANAVIDALGEFGVDHIDMPITPERVWRVCRHRVDGI